MQIPLSWLKEFVDIDIPPELLAEKLTTAGLEVGSITYIGVPQTDAAHIRTQYGTGIRYPKSDHLVWNREKLLWGAIHEVKPHPGADRLVLAMVDYGAAELEQCVTGAPNLFEYKGQGVLPAPLYTVIALEGAEHGVTSNCVNPAYVRTPLVEGQIADQAKAHGLSEDEVVAKVMLAPAAIKRLIEPEEVAEAVAYLCSPVAVSVTGTNLVMDGGWSAH